MKKLIITGAFLMFGTLLINAQTTPKKDNMKAKAEKNLKSTELKMDTSSQNMEMRKKVDTAEFNQKQKLQREVRKDEERLKDGMNNEAVKPVQPAPGQLE
jgi:uncharacterized protein YycO